MTYAPTRPALDFEKGRTPDQPLLSKEDAFVAAKNQTVECA